MRILERKHLPFGALANTATIISLIACYATRIRIWIPALEEPIKNWVNIHLQAAIIVAAAGAAVVGVALDRRHHQSVLPLAVGAVGFALIDLVDVRAIWQDRRYRRICPACHGGIS